jgi:pimeloyl-ACP methyl ester carboxylesterase
VYQLEIPDNWNGRLVLYMHGFGELSLSVSAGPPDGRRYLIGHGYAWGASSFSSSSMIPGRAADETAALWDYFSRTYGRPERSYVMGLSMGGMATHIAAERYADRYDGALSLCGGAGLTPSVADATSYFVVGAYVAGVTQAELDATTDVPALVYDRIVPALRAPARHRRFLRILAEVTGGRRPFAREGLAIEEQTSWRRSTLLVETGIASNAGIEYRLGPGSPVSSEAFNRDVVRVRTNPDALGLYLDGNTTTGDLQVPLVALHTTGDGQVPIEQARILRRNTDAAGKGDLLVERVFRDPGHCGFTSPEIEAGLEALVGWVERGVKPEGSDVLVDDLREVHGFELSPRPGLPSFEDVPGVRDRAAIRGDATLDGAPLNARFLGAVVRRGGLVSPCQATLTGPRNGRYEIEVMADAETRGCGVEGAEVILWTYVDDDKLYTTEAVEWPGDGERARFAAHFSSARPRGTATKVIELNGEVFDAAGDQLPGGTVVEAFIGETRCAVGSVRRTGSYAGYILNVVGPESAPGCELGATITFRVDGKPAIDTAVNTRGENHGGLDLTVR